MEELAHTITHWQTYSHTSTNLTDSHKQIQSSGESLTFDVDCTFQRSRRPQERMLFAKKMMRMLRQTF